MGIAMLDITDEELDAMETVDVRTVDIDTLTDIRDIKIDTKLPVEKSWRFLQSRRITFLFTVLEIMW